MKTYRIHFIRNGLTEGSEEGRYIGHTDAELSREGILQLEDMQRDYAYPRADAVLSSPLRRCTHTARLLYPDLEPIEMEGLIEYNFGEFDGRTADELLSSKKADLFTAWLKGGPDSAPPFGESNAQFQRRVCSTMERIVDGVIQSGTADTVLVTHGGVISTIFAAFALPEAPPHEWLTPCGCGYTARITPSLWMRGSRFEAVALIPAADGAACGEDAQGAYVWGDVHEEGADPSARE